MTPTLFFLYLVALDAALVLAGLALILLRLLWALAQGWALSERR